MATTFNFTPEQLRKIYDGDIDARNQFFFDKDNHDIITRMAQSAMNREKHPTVTIDDLIQGAYVDMDYFCVGVNRPVTNYIEICGFLRWSFHLAPYGGLAYCREHNPKITGKCKFFDTTYTDGHFLRLDALMRENSEKRGTSDLYDYADTDDSDNDFIELGVVDDTEQHEDNTDEYVEVFGEYLTPKNRDVFAFIMQGYTDTQIGELLGITQNTASTRKQRLRAAFGKRLDDIVKKLAEYGINADGIADRKPKRFYKMSEEQRAYHREQSRLKRERKRAEKTPHDVA